MRGQKGLSLIGLLIISAVLVFVAIVGFRLVPSYIEYFSVKRVLNDIVHAPESRGASLAEIKKQFDSRAVISDIKTIKGADLDVTKQGDGFLIAANYQVQVPLFGNVSACVDFQAESSGK
jgi:hypothetical protein